MSKQIKNVGLIVAGTILGIVGVIGIIIPFVPGWPFLLMAGACFKSIEA